MQNVERATDALLAVKILEDAQKIPQLWVGCLNLSASSRARGVGVLFVTLAKAREKTGRAPAEKLLSGSSEKGGGIE